jgi:hypothetical protein
MIDLNTLIPANSGVLLGDACCINDRGEIAGVGFLPNGDTPAFLLIPCDGEHPNLEGCDYSPVEVSAVAASRTTETAPQKQLTPQEVARIRALLMNRHRGFMPRTAR